MANEEHLKILEQGVEVWNRWREKNPTILPDLSGTNLGGAKLRRMNFRRANFIDADLNRVDLKGANLIMADLRRANLNKADLCKADLRGAHFREADLREAHFREAYLVEAHFSETDLGEADLSGALLGYTMFASLDLSEVTGLEAIEHVAPSTVGVDTIYRSGGNIPEAFLRGCGVPDTFIAYITSLIGEAIQYHSCFISYSTKDDSFARRLHNDLQGKGVRCWFAPEDMKIGDEIRPRIDQSIRLHDKLLVVLSDHSIDSDWVQDEVETAIEEESKRKVTVLFPIRLDEAVMETNEAWAAKIRRTRHIGDFSHWKDHDSYQGAFNRLLRDLKAEEV